MVNKPICVTLSAISYFSLCLLIQRTLISGARARTFLCYLYLPQLSSSIFISPVYLYLPLLSFIFSLAIKKGATRTPFSASVKPIQIADPPKHSLQA